ncbi:PDZ domain-containing protein [Caproiciproducens galactitolivorans]|uniref:Carboxy-terminal processing protease CtpA n=1 Tax=Caproiciproducens galactitolivorans TaxID=642589 RepID=A0A4Z0Y9R7_9FIRM|nr:S41 family peptidase [Caproiciproducens galactitolivorans]QEY35389.1 PDZ domain-containing protein [Caproiciproducens galactitolivorans]TGJ75700.1 carboxy-terminal processing protease CtpA precursor [Caproiciproducens galactitolivorans]
MSRKLSWGAAVALVAVTASITVSLTYVYAMKSFNSKVADINERQAMYTKLSEIDQKTRQVYIGSVNEKELNDGICAGYVAGLGNAQAKYLSAEKYKAYLNSSSEKSVGVGIKTVQDKDGNMEVIEVTPGSPAEKSGIKKGDTVVSVDDKEVIRLTYGDALNKLDGVVGSKVKLGILRPQENEGQKAETKTELLSITVTRAEYAEQTLISSMINGNVAYLKISAFTDSNAEQFNNMLAARIKEGASGIVIDLRSNSGGSIRGMAEMLDTLLPAGNTVSYKDKAGKVTVQYTSGPNTVNLPISVIVNRNTFGAAEIFAADIKDYKKGLLVGEKTAGLGTKDEVKPLSDGSAVILPVANYLTLNGEVFNGKGIAVDIQKELTSDQEALLVRNQLRAEQDPQLQAAVSALIRQGVSVEKAPGTESSPASSKAKAG